MQKFISTDEYIASFPEDVQIKLTQIRNALKQAVPKAHEVISYNMPAIKTTKVVVYYAGYKNHIGYYPTAEPMVVFKDKLSKYKTSKGAIQFPMDEDLPLELIKEIAVFREKAVEDGY